MNEEIGMRAIKKVQMRKIAEDIKILLQIKRKLL